MQESASPALGHLTFEVTSGPRRGARLIVDRTELVLGRMQAGAALFEGDPTVSHRHAVVRMISPGRWTIEDAGSTNGTFVNDQRVVKPTVLKVADRLLLGDTTLQVASPATDETAMVTRVRQLNPEPDPRHETPSSEPGAAREELGAAFSRAWSLYNNQKYKESAVIFTKLAGATARKSEAYYGLGLIYLKMDDKADAEKYLLLCLEVDRAHANAMYFLGTLAEKSKHGNLLKTGIRGPSPCSQIISRPSALLPG
jgi:pSer/pThr/pTyr-binding forkhead associated (FHA) protein